MLMIWPVGERFQLRCPPRALHCVKAPAHLRSRSESGTVAQMSRMLANSISAVGSSGLRHIHIPGTDIEHIL